MAVSVRMDPLLERELEGAAQRAGVTKSQFIIDAVERALGRKDPYSALLNAHRRFGLDTEAQSLAAREPEPPLSAEYSRQALRDKLAVRHEAALRDWAAYQAARQRGETWHPDDSPATGERG